ncbi:MAG: D-sedoheptulose 7-phosphate isomerase [Candidatus Saganbacteria bacterium]|uniref:Phosphoheptose isomerase n=1 Tax=Candidatus Saganbacteria bacterium TaxID=2575572 RepID=A0A833NZF2_UNCSA|nr:MAG: D-sedoheptulose 7-phosphate isomerase [Candidatus Saganbacteria bacterium]
MQEIIKADLTESIEAKKEVLKTLVPKIEEAAKIIIKSIKQGGKVMFCGNGGSAADAQHLAAELIGRFKKERGSLSAIALSTDTSILTSLGNDYGFEIIFSRQIEGLGKKGDVLVGISTSGESANVFEAVKKAKSMEIKTIGLLGCLGGRISDAVDLAIIVPSKNTPRIQESHITIGHIICNLVERELFPQ